MIEEVNMHKKHKITTSIIVVLIAILLIIFIPRSKTDTLKTVNKISDTEEKTIEEISEDPFYNRILEWAAIGLLALPIWLWRKELGITSIGPITGSTEINQQEPKIIESSNEKKGLKKEFSIVEKKGKLENIPKLFKKYYKINASIVAHELKISRQDANILLYELTKNQKIRADGFPVNTIYTPIKSLENQMIDYAREQIKKEYPHIEERRYVLLNKYEIDALFESDDKIFVLDTVYLKTSLKFERIERSINLLNDIAKIIDKKEKILVIVIGCDKSIGNDSVKEILAKVTYSVSNGILKILTMNIENSET